MSDHVSAPPAVGSGPSHPTAPSNFGALPLAARYLLKSVRRWRMVGDTRCIYIGSGSLLPILRPYPKRSDETVYCHSFTAHHVMLTSQPRHAHVTASSTPPECPPRHRSDLSTTSLVPVDHSQAATSPFRTRPHPMTSCWRHPKNAPKPKKSIFGQNLRFFRIFLRKTTLPSACKLRPFRRQPAESHSRAVATQKSTWTEPPPFLHDQVFTQFSMHLVYSILHW